MPKCKNDPYKSYKGTEPSPKWLGYCVHAEELDKIRIGLDGNKWKITKTLKGVKRWTKEKIKSSKKIINNILDDKNKYKIIKKNLKGYKTYFTHFNYERSYLVYVKKDVYIYKINEMNLNNIKLSKKNNDNKYMYTKLVEHIKPKEIFIGKSPKIPMTEFSGGYCKEFDGNTILLLLDNNNNVLINDENIKKFTTKMIKF